MWQASETVAGPFCETSAADRLLSDLGWENSQRESDKSDPSTLLSRHGSLKSDRGSLLSHRGSFKSDRGWEKSDLGRI
jgi:hypothetical protein